MEINKIEAIELSLLLDAIYKRYGYDFRGYATASIQRRVHHFTKASKFHSVSELIPAILYDSSLFQGLLLELSITVTEMFRDPLMFKSLRERVIPYLKSYPSIKIWHAGCATGQEAYSLAILIEEEGLKKHATIYATDFNDPALAVAKEGIYDIEKAKQYSQNYHLAGGTQSFSDYYRAKYNAISMKKSLTERVVFANHNLVTDGIFSEIHLIFCRNVLIYFNKELQKKVLHLFWECLPHNGFLCLGSKESLLFSGLADKFSVIDDRYKIFQKKGR